MISIRSAIIVAPDEKGMLPVFGIPAIRRLVLLVHQAGVQKIYIVGRVNLIRPILSDLFSSEVLHQAEDPELLDEFVYGLALPEKEKVMLLKANQVVDQYSLRRLIESAVGPNLYVMKANGEADADGIYVATREDLPPLLRLLWQSNGFNLKKVEGAEPIRGVPGLPYVIGKGGEEARISEARLTAALSFQTAADDGFLARHVDRPFSRFLSKRLAHTGVTPNQITLGGFVIGLTGALFLSRPGYWLQLVGSLLFLFCVVVDGLDGEVARLKLQETSFGHYLDVVTDNIVHLAIFVGIAFGLHFETGEQRYLHLLWFLLGGFGLCAVSVYHRILRRSPAELRGLPKATRLMALLANRDFAYLVVAFAFIHHLDWFFMATTVGTYLFAATLWALLLLEKTGTSTRPTWK